MAFAPPIIELGFKVSGDTELLKRFQDARSGVAAMVHSTLEYLAQQVAARARSRARRVTGQLAAGVGYRFTMGKSGLSADEGDRVVIRGDIGKRAGGKAKAYAMEMGQWGKVKPVKAHMRSTAGNVRRSERSRTGRRQVGGVEVRAYQRRFKNRAQPFLGPAGEEMRPDITQALTVALPRRLARLMAGESQGVAA